MFFTTLDKTFRDFCHQPNSRYDRSKQILGRTLWNHLSLTMKPTPPSTPRSTTAAITVPKASITITRFLSGLVKQPARHLNASRRKWEVKLARHPHGRRDLIQVFTKNPAMSSTLTKARPPPSKSSHPGFLRGRNQVSYANEGSRAITVFELSA